MKWLAMENKSCGKLSFYQDTWLISQFILGGGGGGTCDFLSVDRQPTSQPTVTEALIYGKHPENVKWFAKLGGFRGIF